MKSPFDNSKIKGCLAIMAFQLIAFLSFTQSACKHLVEIAPPINSITTVQAFKDSANSCAAMEGVYASISSPLNVLFLNGSLTLICGIYSDELVTEELGGTEDIYYNRIPSVNTAIGIQWNKAYEYIYLTNACIEGLSGTNGISEKLKFRLIGEAKFIRALIYFYLINLYGDVPYVASTKWEQEAKSERSSTSKIYQEIIKDLLYARDNLPADFPNGERTKPNRWTALALLARTYLYTEKWQDAEMAASAVIEREDIYSLNPELNKVFDKNNSEAILQWYCNQLTSANVTAEGIWLVPYSGQLPPYYLSEFLLSKFETGDLRRENWVDSVFYQGKLYLCPYKYKNGYDQFNWSAQPTQYYTVMRLAELFLIRSEARFKQDKMNSAIDDINKIRSRAGLNSLSYSVSKQQLITAIEQERSIELLTEWGHRWLDLKRWDKADEVMTIVTPSKGIGAWAPFKKKFPIPYLELERSPFLTQNEGY